MTTHYVDITVVPDPETGVPPLLGALYDRLHLALVQQRLESVGISFPGYGMAPRTLGATLRLHGGSDTLRSLLQTDWLKGMRDHVRMTDIAEAPSNAPHRTVQRKQFKTSADRLRRRRMRRKGETAEQAAQAIPSTMERRPGLPYVHLRSHSTGQPFCLFIALGPLAPAATPGSFNSYGLGGTTTIPWF
ncbi:type I-F CRISPR-associated endoribonuclease Cas6/Csy4 [Frateuria sp. Soil773]|uniref:type I-F CRISPR-associated endoribonuclease Cas6/Csy4 n=1 Tax=Frateuria sp. Soil773 TaxID=1736407 RepID=UPI0006F2BDF9|nr:type I-F CRISPR-associated endoribonuclease Cas6/Csy4 [Frateuria sp. Soil773]KRE92400.1 type I-F CRISPR-associated endoribonuclease Cas6/Csy4 [Frateuria sp. Soil773]